MGVEHWLVWCTARAGRSFGITKAATPPHSNMQGSARQLSAPRHSEDLGATRLESECFADAHAPGPRVLAPGEIRTKIHAVLLADLEP